MTRPSYKATPAEIEYHEALELAAEKLTRAIKEYEEVTKLRARIAYLEEENAVLDAQCFELGQENSMLRETCDYLRSNHE